MKKEKSIYRNRLFKGCKNYTNFRVAFSIYMLLMLYLYLQLSIFLVKSITGIVLTEGYFVPVMLAVFKKKKKKQLKTMKLNPYTGIVQFKVTEITPF